MDLNITDPEQIKQLISALQKLLPSDDDDNMEEDEEFSSKIKTKTTRASKGKKKIKNKFMSMPEMRMHKEDAVIDKKLAKSPPTPRTRRFQALSVKCRVCGKTEKINPGILPDTPDRYKCNKCSAMAGG